MEDEESNIFNFSDELVPKSKEKKDKKEFTLDEWIWRKPSSFLYNCVGSRAGHKHIEKYLSYDWTNPSEETKKALAQQLDAENLFHPIEAIAKKGDPTGGALLNLVLENSNISVKDFVCKQSKGNLLSLAAPLGHLLETEVFLQHGSDPLESDGKTLEAVVRASQIDVLKLFKKYVIDVDRFFNLALGEAARSSIVVLKYLIEEEKRPIEGRYPDKTVLQLVIRNYNTNVSEATSLILPLISDINESDSDGNTLLFYAINYYDGWLLKLILDRNPNMNATARKFSWNADENEQGSVLFYAVASEVNADIWKLLIDRCSVDIFKQKNSLEENLLHYTCRSGPEYNFFEMILETLREKKLLGEMLAQKDEKGNLPIFTAISELARLEDENKSGVNHWDKKKAVAREMIRKLISLAKEYNIDTATLRSGNNESLEALLAKHDLLPKERRISPKVFTEQIDLDLGDVSHLPRDVLVNIFQWLKLSEAVTVLTVSKKFFQALTSKQVWAKELPESNFGTKDTFEPFSKLCAIERVKRNMNLADAKGGVWFSEIIEVTNGEGNLTFEAEFIFGLKLNEKPIIASFPDNGGSVVRCFVRCGSLTEEKQQYIAKLENLLNGGIEELNLSTFREDMIPFMNVMNNARYVVSLMKREKFQIHEFNSDAAVQFFDDYPSTLILLFTQPSDRLDRSRIEHYKNEIRRGKRPVILLVYCYWEYYIIDGHHKMKAYMETDTIGDAVFITIELMHSKRLSRNDEMKYIVAVNQAMNVYTRASRYHTYPEDPKRDRRR